MVVGLEGGAAHGKEGGEIVFENDRVERVVLDHPGALIPLRSLSYDRHVVKDEELEGRQHDDALAIPVSRDRMQLLLRRVGMSPQAERKFRDREFEGTRGVVRQELHELHHGAATAQEREGRVEVPVVPVPRYSAESPAGMVRARNAVPRGDSRSGIALDLRRPEHILHDEQKDGVEVAGRVGRHLRLGVALMGRSRGRDGGQNQAVDLADPIEDGDPRTREDGFQVRK